jgi:hypothetical protein
MYLHSADGKTNGVRVQDVASLTESEAASQWALTIRSEISAWRASAPASGPNLCSGDAGMTDPGRPAKRVSVEWSKRKG